MKIYLASPYGFAELMRPGYEEFKSYLREHFEVHCPWEEGFDPAEHTRFEVGFVNAQAIRNCDVVVAILDGADVDSGTASEIGYAYGLEKPVVGYRNDIRAAHDWPKAQVNLQVEYFIEHGIHKSAMSVAKEVGNILG